MRENPSPNHNERANGQSPSIIVIHYTGTKTAAEAESRFCNGNPDDSVGCISPHYMIGEGGEVIKMVDENRRAWHAGKSKWKAIDDLNSASIGIEIWNSGHEFDHEDFLTEQIDALIDLIGDIRTRWDIPNANILGHSDIAPGRKVDPGEKFPWRRLEVSGIGLMPELSDPSDAAKELLANPDLFYKALAEYGFTYTDDRPILLKEFRRHFLPDLIDEAGLDLESCAAILSLQRQAGDI